MATPRVFERVGPALRVEADGVGSGDAVQQLADDVGRQDLKESRLDPRGVTEMRDTKVGPAGAQQRGDERKVVVVDEHGGAGRGGGCGGVGQRLVHRAVGDPRVAKVGVDRGARHEIEHVVVPEPERAVGHDVVRGVEYVGLDAHKSKPVAVDGEFAVAIGHARGGAIAVGHRGGYPHHVLPADTRTERRRESAAGVTRNRLGRVVE